MMGPVSAPPSVIPSGSMYRVGRRIPWVALRLPTATVYDPFWIVAGRDDVAPHAPPTPKGVADRRCGKRVAAPDRLMMGPVSAPPSVIPSGSMYRVGRRIPWVALRLPTATVYDPFWIVAGRDDVAPHAPPTPKGVADRRARFLPRRGCKTAAGGRAAHRPVGGSPCVWRTANAPG